MSIFLKTGMGATCAAMAALVLAGCQPPPAQDDELKEQVAALQESLAELRTEIQANQALILKKFKIVHGGQQTMIRRGVVIVPKDAKKPVLPGDATALKMGGAPTLGPADAKVEVIEFAEFQCPYCMKNSTVLKDLVAEYPGQVRAGFKHHPLTKHRMAVNAGKAAWAAQQQGKFWEMHDALFSSRGKLDPDVMRGHAEAIGLDMAQFDKDYQSQAALDAVFLDRRTGRGMGVKGTPSFYVNGRYIGNDPARVRQAINAALTGELSKPAKPPA